MWNRLRYVCISLLVLSIVTLLSIITAIPHQAAAYATNTTAPLSPNQGAIPSLLVAGEGPLCIPEAIRITYDNEQQSACFVESAQVQLPRVSHLFAGMYAGFVKGDDGQIVRFCPWKLYSVYIPLVAQVTITGRFCRT